MGGYGSGGHNKTHRQLENYHKIDSFTFVGHLNSDKYLCYKDKVEYHIPGGDLVYDVKSKTAGIIYSDGGYCPVELSRVSNIDGKSYRMYFHCPYCGRRVRYLYDFQKHYVCRHCLNANYRIQQTNGMNKLRKQMENIIEKKLQYSWWRHDRPDLMIFELYYIPKLPYMRWEKYNQYMQEYTRLQKEYEHEFWGGMIRCGFISDGMMSEIMSHIDSI